DRGRADRGPPRRAACGTRAGPPGEPRRDGAGAASTERAMSLAALVLAAGESARVGRPKPLLEVAGETFLGRILHTLDQLDGLDVRVVVLGHQATQVRRAVDFHGAQPTTFRGYRQGMLASFKHGARYVLKIKPDLEALLLALVDQPMVQAETYAAL